MQKRHCSTFIYFIFCVYVTHAFLRKVNHAKFLKSHNLRNDGDDAPPAYWDWRTHGVISPVRDQGECLSAWAYAVTAAVEAQAAIWLNISVRLSNQMLIDCDEFNKGCRGGYTLKAYAALLRFNGSVYEEEYNEDPDHEKSECKYTRAMKKIPVLGYSIIKPDEAVMMHYLYKYGPLVAAINSESMHQYVKGIDKPKKNFCKPSKLDHAVLIVGYGVQVDNNYKKKKRYWIIKNSWGDDWGEDGYYRIVRNENACGITSDVSIPIIPVYS